MQTEENIRYLAEQARRRQADLTRDKAYALAHIAAISYDRATAVSRFAGKRGLSK